MRSYHPVHVTTSVPVLHHQLIGNTIPQAQESVYTSHHHPDHMDPSSFVISRQGNHNEVNEMMFSAPGASSSTSLFPESEFVQYHLGIYGMKRFAFYLLLLFISIIVLINSALIVWIMTVINFSPDGVGRLKVHSDGVSMGPETQVSFQRPVFASHLSSKDGKPLTITSAREISLNSVAKVSDGKTVKEEAKGRLLIGSKAVTASAFQLVVRDPEGKLLLLVDKNNLVIATQKLKLKNPEGIKFNCSIQSPLILGGLVSSKEKSSLLRNQSSFSSDSTSSPTQLKIESLSRGMNILAPQGASFASDRNDINMMSLKDWKFTSRAGRITLDASSIDFTELQTVFPSKRGKTYPGIHQLCICPKSGMLFMSPPEGPCFPQDVCSPNH